MTLAEPGEAIEKSEDTSVKKTKKVKPPPKAFVLEGKKKKLCQITMGLLSTGINANSKYNWPLSPKDQ